MCSSAPVWVTLSCDTCLVDFVFFEPLTFRALLQNPGLMSTATLKIVYELSCCILSQKEWPNYTSKNQFSENRTPGDWRESLSLMSIDQELIAFPEDLSPVPSTMSSGSQCNSKLLVM